MFVWALITVVGFMYYHSVAWYNVFVVVNNTLFYAALLKAIQLTATDVTIAWSVRVRMSSVTFVHPTKAVGRNGTPFGSDSHVVPSNIVLDRDPGPHEEIWGSEHPIRINVTNHKILCVTVDFWLFCIYCK